eukprot:TRINITY_DN19111_c0_g1_i1.p1 TRINITY_DN19111_c0_g1~~TRINITY_DN19111_c0_g1_i1.p1  ORF type:complete len:246 (+),score=26.32 TRINITY_DN19111_c0_g1_i1:230-967(+)
MDVDPTESSTDEDDESEEDPDIIAQLVALSYGDAGDEAVLTLLAASGEQLYSSRAGHGCGDDARAEVSLCLAAGRGDLQAVDRLLQMGIDPNCAPSFQGMTPCMFAARFGHFRLLEMLLDLGVRTTSVTSSGATALSLCRSAALMQTLARHELQCDGGRVALLQAVCLGHAPTVLQALLDVHVHPDQHDSHGRTALQISVQRVHLTLTELLLARGANPMSVRGLAAANPALHTLLEIYKDEGPGK